MTDYDQEPTELSADLIRIDLANPGLAPKSAGRRSCRRLRLRLALRTRRTRPAVDTLLAQLVSREVQP